MQVSDVYKRQINGCVNKGKITGVIRAAGIAGECKLDISTNAATAGEYPCKVLNCYNTGAVSYTHLMAAESTGWDGTSKTEPATDGDGVYLISTAEELYWFATKTRTSATKTISGRLISDIDLNNQNWQNKEMGLSLIHI